MIKDFLILTSIKSCSQFFSNFLILVGLLKRETCYKLLCSALTYYNKNFVDLQNLFFSQFFGDLTVHLKQENVINTQQLTEYDDLMKSKKVLELMVLSEATRFEEHQQKSRFRFFICYDAATTACKNPIVLLICCFNFCMIL